MKDLNEIYWELLRRTPGYRDFYEEHAEIKSLSRIYHELLHPGGKPTFTPRHLASIMALQKFGVRFWQKGYPYGPGRNSEDKLFPTDGIASIVSPDIPYNKAPCEIYFIPKIGIELIECREFGIPQSGESPGDKFLRKGTSKEEALFRVRLNRPVKELIREFEREIQKLKRHLKKAGKLKSMDTPLFGEFFSNSHLRRLKLGTFHRYLHWYDLYMGLKDIPGISFRAVAHLDNIFPTKTADDILANIKNRTDFVFDELGIGENKIPERNVTKSIQMIYKIIYREDIKTLPGRKKDTKKPEALFKKRIPLDSFERETIRPGRHIKKKSTSWPDSPSE